MIPEGERSILITGGTSGLGLSLAKDLVPKGYTVHLGTRNADNFLKALQELDPDYSTGRVHPFFADFSIPNQVRQAVDNLSDNFPFPQRVVHAAAGGLEPFCAPLFTLCRELNTLRRKSPESLPQAIDKAKEQCLDWSMKYYPQAKKINATGSEYFVEQLALRESEDTRYVYTSSIWSTLFGDLPTPSFYRCVAETKHEHELYLKDNADRLLERGVKPIVVTGSAILDTNVGRMVNVLMVPLLEKEAQEKMRDLFISSNHMVHAVKEVLFDSSSPFEHGEYPQTRFVVGTGGEGARVSGSIDKDDEIYNLVFPI